MSTRSTGVGTKVALAVSAIYLATIGVVLVAVVRVDDTRALIGLCVATMAVGLGAIGLAARRLTRPIEQLRQDMLELARRGPPPLPATQSPPPSFELVSCESGGAEARGPASRGLSEALLGAEGDELAQLRQGFEFMVYELQQRMAQLARTTEERECAKRLAEIGGMAATVAHEVRNPLNTIQGAVYHLHLAHGANPEIGEFTQLIEEQIARLTAVTGHLLDASRPLEPSRESTDLNTLVRDTVMSQVRECPARKVDIEFRLEPTLPPVPVDRRQVQQILENLVENSLQAMGGEGKIALETRMSESDSVVLRISDDGPGIRAEHHDRVFDPFFTTRTSGTGLGLYIVNRIVRAHGGAVRLDTTPGPGARFEVRLPLEAPASG